MDATVWWGGPGEEDDLDIKFRNTTDGYLLLREYVAEDGYVRAEIWGRPNGVDVEMYSEPTSLGESDSEWITYQKVEKDGEVLFDGVLHEDSYEPLVDEHGKEIPPSAVPVAPVDRSERRETAVDRFGSKWGHRFEPPEKRLIDTVLSGGKERVQPRATVRRVLCNGATEWCRHRSQRMRCDLLLGTSKSPHQKGVTKWTG